MKKAYIILFCLSFQQAFAQVDFQSNSVRNFLHPELSNQINQLFPQYDFQLRFWIDGSLIRQKQKRLIIMSYYHNKWEGDSYKIVNRNKTSKSELRITSTINDCDLIWLYFIQNNILNLQTPETIKLKLNELQAREGSSRFLSTDGQTYYFEFITKEKYKRLEYSCPITLSEHYPEIPGLLDLMNIIKRLFLFISVH